MRHPASLTKIVLLGALCAHFLVVAKLATTHELFPKWKQLQ